MEPMKFLGQPPLLELLRTVLSFRSPAEGGIGVYANLTRAVLAALLCFGLVLTLPAHSKSLEGRVVAVSDGDTVTVLDGTKVQHKIRLSGIDAPEKLTCPPPTVPA